MKRPWCITFTGIDEYCELADIFSLLELSPRIELAMLYSEAKAGKDVRYPNAEWIQDTARDIEHRFGHGRVALHVCGRAVRKIISGARIDADLGSLYRYRRIQLNGAFDLQDMVFLREWIDGREGQVITQYDANPKLHEAIHRGNHRVLFDASGGRGMVRKEWPRRLDDCGCGYAGGLSPDNLRPELPRIAQAAEGAMEGYWIDMESGLRDEQDCFDVGLAKLAFAAVLAAEQSFASTVSASHGE